jgi:hypothetical protein
MMQKEEIMKRIGIVFVVLFGLSMLHAQKPEIKRIEQGLSELHRVDYPVFQKGERIEYLVHYGIVDAGKAVIEIKNETHYYGSREALHVVGKGRSVGAFDWVFKVRDTYESFIDAKNIHPYEFKRDVSEGGYEFKQHYKFEHDENKVKTEKGEVKRVPYGIQDMISAFYFARTLDLSKYEKGEIIVLQAFMDGKIEPLKIRYTGRETIKTEAGKFRCLKFEPIVQPGRVFDEPGDLTVYITDDKNRIPVLAKAGILVGSIKMELTNYSQLSHPVALVSK